MVGVEIKEVERKSRCFLLEFTPCADTNTSSVPAQFRLFRILCEPEMAIFKFLNLVLIIKNSSIFASLFAVVSTHAYIIIGGKLFQHIVQLLYQYLLSTKDIRIFKFQLVANNLASLLPNESRFIIMVVFVSYVIATNK